MSISKNVRLNCYSSMKKNEKDSYGFFAYKIGFESQILALFDTSRLHQFSKFNNFLWVCWILGKNISNFVPPAWKLDNPYYHSYYQLCMFLFLFSDLWSRCLWIPLGPPYIVESKEGCSMLGPCMLHPIGIHFSLTSHMRKRLTLCSYQIISVNPSQFFVDAPTNLGLLWLFCLFFILSFPSQLESSCELS